MKINEFINDFNSKRISADPQLPKYQGLVKREIQQNFIKTKETVKSEGLAPKSENPVKDLEKAQVELADSIINTVEEAKIAVGSDIAPHVNAVIDTEYTTILQILQDKDIQKFNDIIGAYLRSESGWGTDLIVRSDRPGVVLGGTFSPALVDGDGELGWVNFEDQVMFEAMDKEKLNKSRPGWIDRLFALFSNSYHDKIYIQQSKSLIGQGWRQKKKEEKPTELTVEDFFSQIKIKVSEAEKFKTHLKTIFTQIENAKALGQVALLENLAAKLVIEVYEGALSTFGFDKYITFDDLVKLEKKSPRGLSIDQIPNFTRIIPPDVVEAKKKADELQIFDQYVILHFDPEKKAVKETIKEVEEKKEARSKDPILFGLILDSKKLYYIADWIDEFCDLTWDKAIEILGEKEKE